MNCLWSLFNSMFTLACENEFCRRNYQERWRRQWIIINKARRNMAGYNSQRRSRFNFVPLKPNSLSTYHLKSVANTDALLPRSASWPSSPTYSFSLSPLSPITAPLRWPHTFTTTFRLPPFRQPKYSTTALLLKDTDVIGKSSIWVRRWH